MDATNRRVDPPRQVVDPEAQRRRKLADEYERTYGWWHSIDLGHGIVTKGYKSAARLCDEVAAMQFPDVRGKSVLDIGAWDGFYSFEAERRGAQRVVALDHFVWCLDTPAQIRYLDNCRQRGVAPLPYETVSEIWRPHELPGKKGFDLARRVLESRVESVVADFMTADLAALGSFDVVLFLGVLYHLKDPIQALVRLRSVVRHLAVIETEAIEVPLSRGSELWEAFSSDQLAGDPTNWWAPSCVALVHMCKAAGFRDVLVTRGPKRRWKVGLGPKRYRLSVHAFA